MATAHVLGPQHMCCGCVVAMAHVPWPQYMCFDCGICAVATTHVLWSQHVDPWIDRACQPCGHVLKNLVYVIPPSTTDKINVRCTDALASSAFSIVLVACQKPAGTKRHSPSLNVMLMTGFPRSASSILSLRNGCGSPCTRGKGW